PKFVEAYNQGFDGVELDVHVTKDGHLVVFHDDELNAVTNIRELMAQPVVGGHDPLSNVNGVDLRRLRRLDKHPRRDAQGKAITDANGDNQIYIGDLTLAEIKALRLKSHYDPNGQHLNPERN